MTTQQLIEEALSLPVDERIALVDSLLRSVNTPSPDNDRVWIREAKRRDQELDSKQVRPVPGDEVLAKAWSKRKR